MKEIFLRSRERNTQLDEHGQINNGDARGPWKLLQKRMEHSQGDFLRAQCSLELALLVKG